MSQVWFITGSSRGLGRALAEAVLESGARLVATARKPEQLSDLQERYPEQMRTLSLDVTDSEAARRAIASAVEAFGRIDVLVNNAGYGNMGSIEDTPEDDFRAQIETNLFGVVNVTRAALPQLRKQRSGHVLQISSIGGRIGSPGIGAYQTAKWGVEGFSEVLAKELGPLGIKVTIIEPGGFRTDWAGDSMRVFENHPDYTSVNELTRFVRDSSGRQKGDPVRAAQIMLQVTAMDSPPLRLLLGADAVNYAEQADLARMASDRQWRELSVSADYPSA
jgi:NAD(P)-dependent dehydrogenase (short-subunit alcohol dehydrogenase family)